MPKTAVNILIVEHSQSDVDLILHELNKSDLSYIPLLAHTENEYIKALTYFDPHIVLSDYTFPSFDGERAFALKQQIAPEIPFIFVSGTIGEEKAVQLIRNGVSDYALKDTLYTLPDKIIRALQETTDKKEKTISAENLKKVNRLYAFISQVNQNIVRVPDEGTLFRNSCRMAIEFGKFQMAWIGLFNTRLKTISLVEQSGIPDSDAAQFSNATYADGGPQSSVLTTGSYYICNNLIHDLELPGWTSYAKSRGLNSCMVLPIKKSGKIIGTLNLYSSELNFSGSDEVKLLVELTEDISFALDIFESEKKQKETDLKLKINEARFRVLIEKGIDLKTLTSKEGDFIYASPSVSQVMGYDPSDILRMNIFDVLHPDEVLEYNEKRVLLLETEDQPFDLQMQLKHKDGTWRWCEGSVTNMLNEPGIHALVSNFRDVSEKKLADQQKEFDKNNLTALINNTNDLMWSVDREFKLITSNQPFDDMGQVTFGRVVHKGESILDFPDTPEMYKQFKQLYERAFAGESFRETSHFELPAETWTDISYSPIRKGEEIIGAACQSRDITQSKLAERKLQQSESRLKEAQAISHIGNWEYDLESNFHIWSEELYSIFGITENGVVPSMELYLSFVHPEDIEKVRVEVEAAFVTYKATSYDFRFIRSDGSLRYGHTERKFEFDQSGKPVRLLGVLHDITENRLIEEEREKMISSLVQHTKNLEQFTSIISHNLRAPVANILGLSQVLKTNITEEDRTRTEEFLFRSTEQLDEMLKDLNVILQAKSEIREYKETVNLVDLIESIKSSIRTVIDNKHVRILTDFQDLENILVVRSYIYSIFYNLITNSIKYKQRGVPPIIRIRSELDQGKVRITCSDNGIGIDLVKYASQIFGLYKRFHEDAEGKGLGLFMVKTQVETLGGTIRVESNLNSGTEFTIELPV